MSAIGSNPDNLKYTEAAITALEVLEGKPYPGIIGAKRVGLEIFLFPAPSLFALLEIYGFKWDEAARKWVQPAQ